MAIRTAAVTIGTSATELTAAGAPTGGGYGKRGDASRLIIRSGATAFFIGASGVTTANGLSFPANTTLELAVGAGERVYGIVASSTAPCTVMRMD